MKFFPKFLLIIFLIALFPGIPFAKEKIDPPDNEAIIDHLATNKPEKIALDFKDVDITVFARFVSEFTGKNFIIGDRVRGKITVFSPEKVSSKRLYEFFLSVLDSRGLTILQSKMGKELYEIIPLSEIKKMSKVHIYKLINANAEELIKPLTALLAKAGSNKKASRWKESEFEGKVSVVADKNTNSFFITATESDYKIVQSLLEDLDRPEKQVFVEVVIMEVASDKLQEIGTELRAANGFANINKGELIGVGGTNFGGIPMAATIADFNNITGFAAGAIKGAFKFNGKEFLNVAALLRMLQADTDSNVLSTPQILATDKKAAKIIVGENRPFLTGTSQTAGGNVQNKIERKDVGLTLEFTPRIVGDNKVQLQVIQKIDDVTGSVADLGPITKKRQVNTTIIASNLQTIVLGGLIEDSYSKSTSKVPFLGDIPYLGVLFRLRTESSKKSNLLIFITPFIINDSSDLDMIMDLKNKDVDTLTKRNTKLKARLFLEYLRREAVNIPK